MRNTSSRLEGGRREKLWYLLLLTPHLLFAVLKMAASCLTTAFTTQFPVPWLQISSGLLASSLQAQAHWWPPADSRSWAPHYPLSLISNQDFPPLTLLTFWAGWFFAVGSCPGYCSRFSSIPGLYSQDTSSTHPGCDNQKLFPDIALCPLDAGSSQSSEPLH